LSGGRDDSVFAGVSGVSELLDSSAAEFGLCLTTIELTGSYDQVELFRAQAKPQPRRPHSSLRTGNGAPFPVTVV
jgi:hypothetical protein